MPLIASLCAEAGEAMPHRIVNARIEAMDFMTFTPLLTLPKSARVL